MTGTIHKALVAIAQGVGAIGTLILTADAVPFDWDAYDVGLALIWTGQIATIIATTIRANLIPGVTTGIGNEGPKE